MKAKFSAYLDGIAPWIREFTETLSRSYDYVSVLSTDSVGFTVAMSQRSKSVSNSTMTTERGNVVRVYRNGLYSEYAFNEIQGSPADTAEAVQRELRIA